MRMWKRAALALAALCLVASSASAGSFVTVLKADTIYQQSIASTNHHYCDSTRIMNLSSAKMLRLGIQVFYPHSAAGIVDTSAVFAFTVKWHTCGGDTLVTGVCRDSAHTFVWTPRALLITSASAAASGDTSGYTSGFNASTSTFAGGRELRVTVGPGHNATSLGNPQSITVPLVDWSGTPFTAPYISFKWRLITGPALCQYRIALLGERP